MPGRPLRVGLSVDARIQPRWVLDLIADVDGSPDADLIRVDVGADADGPAPSPTSGGRVARAYAWFDRRLFASPNDPMRPADLSSVAAERTDRGPVDVVIDLRAGPRAPSSAPGASTPTWVLVGGAPTGGMTGAARDVLDGRPTTTVAWASLGGDGNDGVARVLARTVGIADPTSVVRNERLVASKARRLLLRALAATARSDPRPTAEVAAPDGPLEPPRRPTSAAMLVAIARLAVRSLRRRLRRVSSREQWFLAVRRATGDGAAPTLDLAGATEIVPPADRFWADPFPVHDGDRWHLFIEEYPFDRHQGHLAVLSSNGDAWEGPTAILDTAVHRSYPFVFHHDGAWYLVPESSALGRVELYRAHDFPTGWTFDRVLLDLPGVDPTLVEIDGRWWMFLGIVGEPGAHNEDLHLYGATSPFGPWIPHRMNPIRSDVRGARPAGRVYRAGDAWYRPGQDGTGGYGSGIVVHRITRLDDDGYDEVAIDGIRPDWATGLVGVHTLNASNGLTVVDARRRRSVLAGPRSRRPV